MPTKLTDADIARLRARAAQELADAAELNSISPEVKAKAEWKMPVAEVDAILDEVARARALLRRIEWKGDSGYRHISVCPECEAEWMAAGGGHKSDCELAALIGK